MKTHQRAIGMFALFLATGCASTTSKPAYSAFEGLPAPKGLEYQAQDSTIIETQGVKAGRVVYRGRIEPQSLALAMRSTLEAEGWRLVGSTLSAQSGSMQQYERAGTSLQVRIWEGGLFSWYTYVEMAAVEMTAHKPALGYQPGPAVEPMPPVVPAPGVGTTPGLAPAPMTTPRPSASVEPPATIIVR